ncbi:MAG: membrane protein insertion efficiency factor YidD [Holophagaceae bacterium]|uniref:Membrane protein insertion efficiency factor YidD n=1 Tax=Candidatus Geothrix skivensis TaxID=2954439 RepID=A0A9D7XHL7_9BACT|nr:membrane protein insertion efficiency factor YidD [Candidatus Geothrix skivensis]
MISFLIRRYQEWAPSKIRGNCRFTPSCSDYMLLAIEKHGALVGVAKGCRRLIRCAPPNGGVDYP